MKAKTAYLSAGMALIIIVAGGVASILLLPSHEKLAESSIEIYEELVSVIGSAQDKKSTETAMGNVEKLADKMKKIDAQWEKLGPPPPALQADLDKKKSELGEKISRKFKAVQFGGWHDPEGSMYFMLMLKKVADEFPPQRNNKGRPFELEPIP